jgi:uncharacterized caspase-like protein
VFINERCTVENIRTAKSLLAHATPDDTVVLFISGHGMHASDAEARYYFLPWEVNIEDIAGTACPFEAVEDILDGIRPRQKLFLMDTCESGELDEAIASDFLQRASAKGIRAKAIGAGALAARGGNRGAPERPFLLEKNRYIYTDLFRRTGAVVFSSSRGYEFSYEPITYSEKENGFFTAAVLQALKGVAADGDKDGIVFLDELEAFVRRTVSARSDGLQNPTVDRDNISIRFGFPAGSGN